MNRRGSLGFRGMVFILTSIWALAGCAGTPNKTVEESVLQLAHNVNMGSDETYQRILDWMKTTFVKSDESIDVEDQVNRRIVATGITNFLSGGTVRIPCRFLMIVEVQETKFVTRYSDFIGMWGEYRNQPLPLAQSDHVRQVKAKLTELDRELVQYVQSEKK